MGFSLKKSFIYIFLTAAILTGGWFLSAKIAYGGNDLKSTLREVAEKIEEISAIKNNESLDKEEREKRELRARTEALAKIFELTLLEDNDLKNRLLVLKNLTDEQIKIKDALLKLLGENKNAYDELRPRLESAVILNQIKQLAADFKNWRRSVYNPKVEKILSFSLVFQQKNTLNIAENRLKKIQSDLQRLEDASVIKKEDTTSLLRKAIQELNQAKNLNRQAEELVTKILAEEFFPITPNLDLTNIDNPDELKLSNSPSVKSLIEESLKHIKTAYRLFLDIGKIVREKLS